MKYVGKKAISFLMALAVSLSVCSAPVGAKWVQENNDKWWYYYDNNPQNYAKNGFKKINGSWFYFDKYGFMQTGWVQDKGKWYYMAPTGKMVTGWCWVDDKCYYFYQSGAMAQDTIIGNSYVNEYGVWTQDKKSSHSTYYSEYPNVPDFGALFGIDRIYYKSDEDGVMYGYTCGKNYDLYFDKLEAAGFKLVDYETNDNDLIIHEVFRHTNGQMVIVSIDYKNSNLIVACYD